jgi:O-antigen ligase
MNRIIFIGLMLIVVISPLPQGSNQEWSWSLCALAIALLCIIWVLANLRSKGEVSGWPYPVLAVLFLLAVSWVLLQISTATPEAWQHPLWNMTSQVLATNLPGSVSLGPEGSWIALMRLGSYVLVFILTFQLCRDRRRANKAFAWMAFAGFVYALVGLFYYWSDYFPSMIFGDTVLANDLRSTFVNRNHFATWQGLTMLCAMAYFYQKQVKPQVMPYSIPQNREARAVDFILKAWKPLTALLLMVTALVLTHSRGGFIAAFSGTLVLLFVLDRRASSHKVLSRLTVGAAVIVVSIAFYLTSEVLLDRIEHTDLTSEERLAVYGNINRAIIDNPLLGFGYGTFGDSFRLYDSNESPFHYDRAHNTWLENTFELGIHAASLLFLTFFGLVLVCWRGVRQRHRDWIYPATGVAA